jgi:hypothetical protein
MFNGISKSGFQIIVYMPNIFSLENIIGNVYKNESQISQLTYSSLK